MEKTKLVATVCENKNERNQIEEFIKVVSMLFV